MSLLKIIETGKISNTIIILVVIVSTTLLFANHGFIEKLKMVEFVKDYGKWVGIAFLVSWALLLIVIFSWIWKGVNNKWYGWQHKKLIIQNIQTMDSDEKAICREFIFNVGTLPLPFTDPAVASLINKRIIYQVGNHGGIHYGEPCMNFTLSEIARNNLTFPMLGLPEKNPQDLSEDDKVFIQNNRPTFIHKYNRW